MCGIVGYIGDRDALPIIMGGLERLEYRGYDSAGIAVLEKNKFHVVRALGKLSELKKQLQTVEINGSSHIGIGHTRWATHGKPSENNAHPHTAGRVSLIHNGIIENYIDLRDRLEEIGCEFKSETDTEIAAHLLNKYLEEGNEPFDALKRVCKDIRGSYAFVAIDSRNPDRLLIAKNATPIVIGFGQNETLVASGIPALLEHTRRVMVLEDGDLAEVMRDSVRIENNGKSVKRAVETVTWDAVSAQKGGFKHFMLKEIHEQVQVIADTFRGRVELEEPRVFLPELNFSVNEIKKVKRVIFLGCGTAWHACLVAKYLFEQFLDVPCEVDYSSEFRYRKPVFDENTLVIAISQSGETADTLAAIDMVQAAEEGRSAKRPQTLAICNVLGSSLAHRVRNTLFTHAGPEISVASTKAFSTQLVAVYLIALYLAEKRGELPPGKMNESIQNLVRLPGAVAETLKNDEQVKKVAKTFHHAKAFLFLGRGICFPIALEGALKLKEISYIHASGYPAAEMKHGPIALIDENMPVVVIVQKSSVLSEKTLSNVREVESRGGQIITITDIAGHQELKKFSKAVIEVPHISEELAPILLTVPLQLLAYHVAVFNGTDVDLPRNLAKSVTVE